MKSIKEELRELSEDEFNQNCFDCCKYKTNYYYIIYSKNSCKFCINFRRNFLMYAMCWST